MYISGGESGFVEAWILSGSILDGNPIPYQRIRDITPKDTNLLRKVSQSRRIGDESHILAYPPNTIRERVGHAAARQTPRGGVPGVVWAGDKDKGGDGGETGELREEVGEGIPVGFVGR